MAPKKTSHESQLKQDLLGGVADTLTKNPGMTKEGALQKVTMEMLENNPWVPPTGCPVNDLPNELLTYIFVLGTKMEEEGEDEEEDEEEEYANELDLIDGWEDSDDEDPKLAAKSLGVPRDDYSEEEDEDEDDDDDDDDDTLPFQVLVSHVCRHWREVALESPTLWTVLRFSEGAPFEKSQVWIERSKGAPLDIYIDCTIPEEEMDHHHPDGSGNDEDHFPWTHGQTYNEEHKACEHPPSFFSIRDLNIVLDIIVPHVAHWRLLEVTVSLYEYMHILLSRLAKCPPATQLEVLELHHYDDGDNYDTFQPTELNTPFVIFSGVAPKLSEVALWGVHLDWEASIPLLTGLRDLELAYHTKDVRPSFATFSRLIMASPNLRTLSLCLSGPTDHNETDNDWGTTPLEIPSLKDLVLCYHEPKYATALVDLLSTPNIHSLALDYDDGDYTEFAQRLTKQIRGKSKSLLAGLEHLKISGLPCNNETVEMVYEQLAGLRSLNLNCSGDELFFDLLMKPTTSRVFCPNLHTITTTGIEGAKMKQLVEARKIAGVPLKKVLMSEEDDIDEKEEKWLREHLDGLEFFEPSDSEEEIVDMDEDEDEDDDMMHMVMAGDDLL